MVAKGKQRKTLCAEENLLSTPTAANQAVTPATEHVWHYGVNDHCPDASDQALKGFTPTHNFKVDFAALCELCGAVPHAALSAKKPPPEGEQCQTVAVQSSSLDLTCFRVMRHVLHSATQLQTLRFSSCCLDVEMLHLLKAGLADSTVQTLHIDWNPVEVPLDAEAIKHLPAEGALEALDDLERRRLHKQAERSLRNFASLLAARTPSGLDAALDEVAALADPNFAATAQLVPLDMRSFTEAVHRKSGLSSEEAERIFRYLDMPEYGAGDGFLTISHVKEVLQNFRPATQDQEMKDPIGTAFAAFIDGTSVLEVVSFRCCGLTCTEAQVMGKALHGSQHLRALNLWGNRICDRGAAALAEAFEHYFGLQYLGLGRNFVTHVGLASFCKVLGVSRIDSKEKADPLLKYIKEHTKDRERKLAKTPPVQKRDANGRERYTPEFYHIDGCEERRDPITGEVFWVWTRNTTLKTLVLEHNPIADVDAVRELQPLGVGDLVLRGTPCAEAMLRSGEGQGQARAADHSRTEAEAEHLEASLPPALVLSPTGGWRLVLQ